MYGYVRQAGGAIIHRTARARADRRPRGWLLRDGEPCPEHEQRRERNDDDGVKETAQWHNTVGNERLMERHKGGRGA